MITQVTVAEHGTSTTDSAPARPLDRRARRRRETIDEILRIAADVMTQDGVNALSMAEIARRLGVQPPSIYKYFDSLLHVYDSLFEQGQLEHLQVMRDAMANAEPGLGALSSGLEASGRWCLANRSVAQLMFWRPVPSFEPSPEAFAPSIEMLNMQKAAIAAAIAAGQLGPAELDQVVHLVSVFIVGVLSQAIANEPDLEWGEGRFTSLFPKLMAMLPALYPPAARQSRPYRRGPFDTQSA
jgi:AcrR family transcriptional regulator